MPAKSRRVRRSLSPGRKVGSTDVSGIVDPNATNRPAKTNALPSVSQKTPAASDTGYPYIISELKWIGITTGIIIAIMIISYIILH